MRTRWIPALGLFLPTLLCINTTRAEDVPSADKATAASIQSLKAVRDRTNDAADKEKLSAAINSLEKLVAQKNLGNEDGKKKVLTRAEFKKMVIGRSKEQIKTLLGKPDSTTELGNSLEYSIIWHYRNRTQDPDAEKVDRNANILFDLKGFAVSVDFTVFDF
jgi:hypothetical protein